MSFDLLLIKFVLWLGFVRILGRYRKIVAWLKRQWEIVIIIIHLVRYIGLGRWAGFSLHSFVAKICIEGFKFGGLFKINGSIFVLVIKFNDIVLTRELRYRLLWTGCRWGCLEREIAWELVQRKETLHHCLFITFVLQDFEIDFIYFQFKRLVNQNFMRGKCI